jgi:hypothetical protein
MKKFVLTMLTGLMFSINANAWIAMCKWDGSPTALVNGEEDPLASLEALRLLPFQLNHPGFILSYDFTKAEWFELTFEGIYNPLFGEGHYKTVINGDTFHLFLKNSGRTGSFKYFGHGNGKYVEVRMPFKCFDIENY